MSSEIKQSIKLSTLQNMWIINEQNVIDPKQLKGHSSQQQAIIKITETTMYKLPQSKYDLNFISTTLLLTLILHTGIHMGNQFNKQITNSTKLEREMKVLFLCWQTQLIWMEILITIKHTKVKHQRKKALVKWLIAFRHLIFIQVNNFTNLIIGKNIRVMK